MLIAHVVQLEVTEVVRVKNDVIHQLQVRWRNISLSGLWEFLPARVFAWLLLVILCHVVCVSQPTVHAQLHHHHGHL